MSEGPGQEQRGLLLDGRVLVVHHSKDVLGQVLEGGLQSQRSTTFKASAAEVPDAREQTHRQEDGVDGFLESLDNLRFLLLELLQDGGNHLQTQHLPVLMGRARSEYLAGFFHSLVLHKCQTSS